MFKTLIFIFLFHFTAAKAAVTIKWLTVASVAIDDGKTRLLFDPAWTRPELAHWLNLETFKSNEQLVTQVLRANDLLKVDAVFSSHSHFDHVVDAPMVSKITGAVFYTDESSERLTMAYKDNSMRTIRILAGNQIRVGDFLITPLLRKHAQVLHLFDFLPGSVPEKTNLSFWDYHVGDTWFYLIEHPTGNILLDQGADTNAEILEKHTKKIDVLLQGVVNRVSDEAILNGYVRIYSPKIYIPLHFDNFLADFNNGEENSLPGVKLEEILAKIKKAYPKMIVDKPLYGRPIKVLEVQR